ncbi:MAG: acyltransferase family protein [Cyanobacteria bacterium J06623_7]
MSKTTRLNGIDLCRGLAAFAVILVHSGDETWGVPIAEAAIRFRHLFYFAVPFFLAASFYFGTKKLPLVLDASFWQKKFKRIILPYLFWSLFYVVMKTVLPLKE